MEGYFFFYQGRQRWRILQKNTGYCQHAYQHWDSFGGNWTKYNRKVQNLRLQFPLFGRSQQQKDDKGCLGKKEPNDSVRIKKGPNLREANSKESILPAMDALQ
jgi:hypothetical protein